MMKEEIRMAVALDALGKEIARWTEQGDLLRTAMPRLEPDDLQDILHHVKERKNLREQHTKLRSMMNRMERPAAATVHEERHE